MLNAVQTPAVLQRHSVNQITVTYDQSFGDGTDDQGFAILPLRSGATRYWVDSVNGNDSNNGFSAATAKQTLAAGVALIANSGNAGHHLMVAGTFTTGLPNLRRKGGFSRRYPTVVQSYDPAAPSNAAKYGKAPRAIVASGLSGVGVFSLTGSPGEDDYIAVRGLDFSPDNAADNSCSFNATQSQGILIENCIFRYCALSSSGTLCKNLVFRRNASFGCFTSDGAHAQNLFVTGWEGLVIEDNVFHHAGWPMSPYSAIYGRDTVRPLAITDITTTSGVSSATVASAVGLANGQFINAPGVPVGTVVANLVGTGFNLKKSTTSGALVLATATGTNSASFGTTYTDIFSHCNYLSTGNDKVIVRRNMYSDACSHGLQARSGGYVYHNVTLDCPLALLLGGGTLYGRTYPGSQGFYFQFGAVPAAGDTITITIGTTASTWTFVASGATGNQINIGASVSATIGNAVTAMMASSDPVMVSLRQGPSFSSVLPGVRALSTSKLEVCYNPNSNADQGLFLTKSGADISFTTVATTNPGVDTGWPDPVAAGKGGALGYRPSGVFGDMHHNLVLGSADINSALTREVGLAGSNTTDTSRIRQNLVMESKSGAVLAGEPFQVGVEFAQPTTFLQDRNVVYNYGIDTGDLSSSDPFKNFGFRVITNQVWDQPTAATNLNRTVVSLPHKRSRTEIFAAVGAASGFGSIVDKDSLLAVMLDRPELPWAKWFVEASLPYYGITLADL